MWTHHAERIVSFSTPLSILNLDNAGSKHNVCVSWHLNNHPQEYRLVVLTFNRLINQLWDGCFCLKKVS